MNHGVRKIKTTAEKEAEKRKADQELAVKFQSVVKEFREQPDNDLSLDRCTAVLRMNPEYYSAWNKRRSIVLHQLTQHKQQQLLQQEQQQQEQKQLEQQEQADKLESGGKKGDNDDVNVTSAVQALLLGELKFSKQSIAQNPKSYWAWFHRKWTVSQMTLWPAAVGVPREFMFPTDDTDTQNSTGDKQQKTNRNDNVLSVDWQTELALCNQLLELDARNFHCWAYRRFLTARTPAVSWTKELEFSSHKIEQNFSNYSAWHHRSQVLEQLNPTADQLTSALPAEFELVRNAFYTETEDQSAWIYHRWLLAKAVDTAESPAAALLTVDAELAVVQELLDLEPESKFTLLGLVHLMQLKLNLEPLTTTESSSSAVPQLQQNIGALLDRLQQVDKSHQIYYQDQKNKLKV